MNKQITKHYYFTQQINRDEKPTHVVNWLLNNTRIRFFLIEDKTITCVVIDNPNQANLLDKLAREAGYNYEPNLYE